MIVHQTTLPERYETNTGRKGNIRSYARATVFAITTMVKPRPPAKWYTKYPPLINVKLHSSYTRRAPDPAGVQASTELTLTRNDALLLASSLLHAVNEIDKEEP